MGGKGEFVKTTFTLDMKKLQLIARGHVQAKKAEIKIIEPYFI